MKMRTTTLLLAALALLAASGARAQVYQYDAAGRLIRAVYPGGGGAAYSYDAADNLVALSPLNVPAAPMELEVSRTSSTEARLRWQASPGAQSYAIERRVVGSSEWRNIATVSGGGTTAFVDSRLVAGVEYEYRIAGIGPDGQGAFSDIAGTIRGDSGLLLTLVPRVAAGSSFVTGFQIINLIDDAVEYRVALYDGTGQPLALPFANSQGGNAGSLNALAGTLPAAGGVFAQTFPTGAVQAGYAVVETGAGFLSVTTSITQLVEGRDPFQAAVALAAEPAFSRFPYVNTRPFTTVMALTNNQIAQQTVQLAAKDVDGVTRCTSNLPVQPGAHSAFAIQDRLACTSASAGVIEVRSDGDGVGPISFVFHDFGPFTTNLPVAPGDLAPAKNVVPRIATGDSFETLLQVTNVGETPTSYRINFYGPGGAPLSVPMADLAGQSIGSATQISGTVPPGGSRTARTLAAGETLAGYALVEVGAGNVAVNSTVTQLVEGRDPFQASAPLLDPLESSRLPFNNTRPFTTVMAVTNPKGGSSRVTFIARSLNGQERCRDIRDLAGMAHDAFVIQDRLACTVNAVGVLEIQADNGGVAPLSFIFHDFGPFTTNLPSPLP
jgi:YD repeat-containing protein